MCKTNLTPYSLIEGIEQLRLVAVRPQLIIDDKGREGLTNFANVIFTDQPDCTETIPFNFINDFCHSKPGHIHVTSPVRAS